MTYITHLFFFLPPIKRMHAQRMHSNWYNWASRAPQDHSARVLCDIGRGNQGSRCSAAAARLLLLHLLLLLLLLLCLLCGGGCALGRGKEQGWRGSCGLHAGGCCGGGGLCRRFFRPEKAPRLLSWNLTSSFAILSKSKTRWKPAVDWGEVEQARMGL